MINFGLTKKHANPMSFIRDLRVFVKLKVTVKKESFRDSVVLLLYGIPIFVIVAHISENISIKIPYCGMDHASLKSKYSHLFEPFVVTVR